jgi:hypothetical protein
MHRVWIGIFLITLLIPVISLAGSNIEKCKKHTDCDDTQVCNDGKCESAVGRTYFVTVVEAKISEHRKTSPNQGKAWDALGGLPDPFVTVYFPDISHKAFSVTRKKDTTTPKWNAYGKIEVTTVDQEIWFCFYDADAADHDQLKTTSNGKSNCTGYKSIIDFIRAGTFKTNTSGDVKFFKATIKRKGGGPSKARTGEKLWYKACNHVFLMAKKEAGNVEEPTKQQLHKAMEGCLSGFRSLPKSIANKAARCIMTKKTIATTGACMEVAAKEALKK